MSEMSTLTYHRTNSVIIENVTTFRVFSLGFLDINKETASINIFRSSALYSNAQRLPGNSFNFFQFSCATSDIILNVLKVVSIW
jgi:hypothetical protein